MSKDNRRRIKPDLLDEIEEHEGDTFTEQILNWNRKQDAMSKKFNDAMERFEQKLSDKDNVSKNSEGPDLDDIRNVMEKVLEENLSQQALEKY